MSKTILTQVKGWTPMIDSIVRAHGVYVAAVFGQVWRYCQMIDGVCRANQALIAENLSLSRKTVNESLQVLVEHGYLEDMTPDLKNRPHTYRDTGKANLIAVITAAESAVTESGSGVTQGYSTVTDSYSTVTQSGMKKESKKGSKETNKRNISPNSQERWDVAVTLSIITGMDLEKNKGQLLKEAMNYTREEIPILLADFGPDPKGEWYREDWRGKDGQLPTLKAIRENWGRWTKAQPTQVEQNEQQSEQDGGFYL